MPAQAVVDLIDGRFRGGYAPKRVQQHEVSEAQVDLVLCRR